MGAWGGNEEATVKRVTGSTRRVRAAEGWRGDRGLQLQAGRESGVVGRTACCVKGFNHPGGRGAVASTKGRGPETFTPRGMNVLSCHCLTVRLLTSVSSAPVNHATHAVSPGAAVFLAVW